MSEPQFIAIDPWCKPFIKRHHVSVMWDGRDVTDEWYPIDHAANRAVCREANRQNAITAAGFNFPIRPPYYHYDALSGRALKIEPEQVQS